MHSPLRILHLVTRRQRRGAEVFAADLSAALAGRGHRVQYAGLNPPPPDPLVAAGVSNHDVSSAAPAVLSLRLVLDLARYLRQTQPDVIQANGGYAMKYAVLARLWARGSWPIVYCNIGLSSDWLRHPLQRLWNRWLLRQAAVTAAVSEASRADLLATYGLDPARVEVVRRGVPEVLLEPERARRQLRDAWGLPAEAHVLLHVGSFSPEKNHLGLLRIAREVHKAHPQAHLVLVGDGPEYASVAARAQAMPYVHLLGLRDDVAALMAGADLLLLPSLTEGIPGVIIEAGMQGLPAVAYRVGGVAEVVQNGDTGMLIERGDEAGLAQAVAVLLADAERRHAMGVHARRFIQTQYTFDTSVDRFEALYHQLVAA